MSIVVVEEAFAVRLAFIRPLIDPIYETSGIAITWEEGFIGIHEGSPDPILGKLLEFVDLFVSRYVAVNVSDCK